MGAPIGERLCPQRIARVVQRTAARAGLDAREAAAHGASERAIARQTGHGSTAIVRGDIRDGDRHRDNAAG